MLKIKALEKTCDFCPSQWEGKDSDDRDIYIRFRWGTLTVTINPFTQDEIIYYEKKIGQAFDGEISEEEMLRLTEMVYEKDK